MALTGTLLALPRSGVFQTHDQPESSLVADDKAIKSQVNMRSKDKKWYNPERYFGSKLKFDASKLDEIQTNLKEIQVKFSKCFARQHLLYLIIFTKNF